MKKYLPQATGFFYLLLFVFCVSTIPVTVKIGLRQQADPLELISLRLVIAVTILWIYFLSFRRDALRLDRAGLIGSVQAGMASCVSTFAYFFKILFAGKIMNTQPLINSLSFQIAYFHVTCFLENDQLNISVSSVSEKPFKQSFNLNKMVNTEDKLSLWVSSAPVSDHPA